MDINEPIINSELVDVIKRLKENNATQEEFSSLNGKCLDIISARLDFGKRVIEDQSPFYIK